MPGTPTTKYAIPTMSGSDIGALVDDWTVSAMGALDSKLAPSDQGTLASRPVSSVGSPSGKAGRTYYATDTGQLFRDNGTGWTEIVLAGATPPAVGVPAQQPWQTIALSGSGFPSANLSYYKDSLGIVNLRGDAFVTTGNVANGTAIGTLPAGARPGSKQYFPLGSGVAGFAGQPALVSITTAGVITFENGRVSGDTVSFGGIHFRAEN